MCPKRCVLSLKRSKSNLQPFLNDELNIDLLRARAFFVSAGDCVCVRAMRVFCVLRLGEKNNPPWLTNISGLPTCITHVQLTKSWQVSRLKEAFSTFFLFFTIKLFVVTGA